MTTGEKKLNFYTAMYKQLEQLEKDYENGFNLDNTIEKICKTGCAKNIIQKEMEYSELVALESAILSTLIGLNREKLELANSKTENRALFQYKDYESDIKIFLNEVDYKEGREVSKIICDNLNFNPTREGCFPYMLEIIQDDNKKRPYDYIAKIRNALLHAEYYLENPNVLRIQNHDDNGNLVFEAKLLMFSFATFVTDFFGIIGVNSSFPLFHMPYIEKFKNEDDLLNFLCECTCFEFDFEKIPDSYKFNGTSALYSRLNSCFGLDSNEKKDIVKEFVELEKEGFKFNATPKELTKEQIANIYSYVKTKYKNIYNNKEMVYIVSALAKLQFSPIPEITNCLGNILTYVSSKKDYLTNNSITSHTILNELTCDEHCDAAFKYAIAILKNNVINYAIECSEFEDIDFCMLDTSKLVIDNPTELERRKDKYTSIGMNDIEAINKLKTEISRNALAHGGKRLSVDVKPGLSINLTDIYHNVSPIGVTCGLKHLNNVLSSEVFKPENITIKEKPKTLKK